MKAISSLPKLDKERIPFLSDFFFDNKFNCAEISCVDDNTLGNNSLLSKISFVLFKLFILTITEESSGKKL